MQLSARCAEARLWEVFHSPFLFCVSLLIFFLSVCSLVSLVSLVFFLFLLSPFCCLLFCANRVFAASDRSLSVQLQKLPATSFRSNRDIAFLSRFLFVFSANATSDHAHTSLPRPYVVLHALQLCLVFASRSPEIPFFVSWSFSPFYSFPCLDKPIKLPLYFIARTSTETHRSIAK